MPAEWLPNAERISCTKSGGSFNGNPWRLVLHTTEGDPGTVDGCRNMAENHGSPPQLWYHPRLRWLGQSLPLNKSGYALAHDSGDPETNKSGAIQVEMFGFASDTWAWGIELDNIGADVVRPLLDAGYPIDLNRLGATTGDSGYGESGDVRFDWGTWNGWTGLCVHANVPGNEHWDAGDINLGRIADAARGTNEEDDMPKATIVNDTSTGGLWTLTLCHLHLGRCWIPDPDRLGDILFCDAISSGGYLASQDFAVWSADQIAPFPDVTPGGGGPHTSSTQWTPDVISQVREQVRQRVEEWKREHENRPHDPGRLLRRDKGEESDVST